MQRPASHVALVYQPMVEAALALAESCAEALHGWGMRTTIASSWNVDASAGLRECDFVVTLGGDGTILRTARWLAGTPTPIVGIQLGRLGFLAEIQPSDLPGALRPYLSGDYMPDPRAMLEAWAGKDGEQLLAPEARSGAHHFLALNDIVVGRGQSLRTVTVDLAMDGERLHRFRCDGLIVATATGSTAYSFAAGGPVLPPTSREIAVTAICPHISALRSLIVPTGASLRLQVWASQPAVLTVDGQIDHLLSDGAIVEASVASMTTLFARRDPPAQLYSRILSKLA
jgi:NAD+ kinase